MQSLAILDKKLKIFIFIFLTLILSFFQNVNINFNILPGHRFPAIPNLLISFKCSKSCNGPERWCNVWKIVLLGPIKHLWWNFFPKIGNSLQLLTIFAKTEFEISCLEYFTRWLWAHFLTQYWKWTSSEFSVF